MGPIENVAQADRAWPFYREAILKYVNEPELSEPLPLHDDALQETEEEPRSGSSPARRKVVFFDKVLPDDPHWPRVVEWLDANQAALEAVWEGAERPRFGFAFGDAADKPWEEKSDHWDEDWRDFTFESTPIWPYAVLREPWRLLLVDSLCALATGQSQRFVRDVGAIVRSCEQMHADLPLPMVELTSLAGFNVALCRRPGDACRLSGRGGRRRPAATHNSPSKVPRRRRIRLAIRWRDGTVPRFSTTLVFGRRPRRRGADRRRYAHIAQAAGGALVALARQVGRQTCFLASAARPGAPVGSASRPRGGLDPAPPPDRRSGGADF